MIVGHKDLRSFVRSLLHAPLRTPRVVGNRRAVEILVLATLLELYLVAFCLRSHKLPHHAKAR